MRKNTFHIGRLLLLLVVASCLDPVDLERVGQADLLVVEGMITDLPVRQKILLSKTVPLNSDTAFSPETGATVWVEDGNGLRTDFLETRAGLYQTSFAFSAQFGTEYQLHVRRADGSSYISEIATMVATPPIDSIYAEFESTPDFFDPFSGYFNFFVDTQPLNESDRYFRWMWESVHEVAVPNPSRWLWTGGNSFIIRERGSENDSLQVEVCYNSDSSQTLNILGLLPGESRVIKHQVRRFNSEEKDDMKIRMSLLVKQYALAERSFNFWNLIKESSGGQGFLFDTQVGTIRGNITNVNDGNEAVLGFFEVVQEQSKRAFFVPGDFQQDGYLVENRFVVDCDDIDPIFTEVDEIGTFMDENSEEYTLCYFITAPPTAVFHLKECAECTLYSSSNKRPDFW